MLGACILQVVLATVFFRKIVKPVLHRLSAMAEEDGRPLPRLLRDGKAVQVAAVAMAVVPLAMWWFLGTEAGAQFWASLGQAKG